MHEALAMVRRDLGPDAAVLHTREFRTSRFFGLVSGPPQIEVTASTEVNVPSRLPARSLREERPLPDTGISLQSPPPSLRPALSGRAALGDDMNGQLHDLRTMVKELCNRSRSTSRTDLPDSLFRLYADLIDVDLNEDLARELLERVRLEVPGADHTDPLLVKAHIARIIEGEIAVTGPIAVKPETRRLVALVGPTGVGKTGGPIPAQGESPCRPDHGRYLSYRRGRTVANLRRHHRSADAGRFQSPRNSRGGTADGQPRVGVDGYRRPQPQGRRENPRAAGVSH
jgi:flagellar biosynthesis protein FlhF